MSGYRNHWDFYRDTARLIAEGATLRDLYEAMLTVDRADRLLWNDLLTNWESLAHGWSQSPSFVPLRLLELFEGLAVSHSDDYILAMVGHLGGRREPEIRLHMLRHDSALRDQLFWRIFEVEGSGEISLTNVDKYSDRDLNWHETVVLLAKEGTIDRARVLHSSLEALNRDFSAYRAGWFSKLYTALAPSPLEAAADQDLLRLSLGSSVTATVSLAAKNLEAVQKAGLLDVAEFVDVCAPALSGSKTAAMGILRMLTRVAADAAAPADVIAEAASGGLTHSHADVQRAAVRLLLTLGREDVARDSRSDIAPAVAAELLPVAAVLPLTREGSSRDILPASITAARPVHPWSDDDARERCAALLEFGESALELELALAWLAVTENAASVLAPLVTRARSVPWETGRFWIAALVRVAVDPESVFLASRGRDGSAEEKTTALPSLVTRLREVASILQGRAPRRRLLATPTDTHGWVDTDVLLDRFRDAPTPFPVDRTQALLRTPPEERQRVAKLLRAKPPVVTSTITVRWHSRESESRRPTGSPQWVWWSPEIVGEAAKNPSATQPAAIPSGRVRSDRWRTVSEWRPLVAASLGLTNPASALPLVAAGVAVMFSAMSEVNHAAGPLLRALASHPGPWNELTAEVLALALASHRTELRIEAAELFAAAIPERLSAQRAALGFAACHQAVTLGRWTTSLSDAATIAPDAVIDLLTHLLPKIARDARGLGGLLAVLLDECIRHQRPIVDAELRDWLAGFAGASGVAKSARAALTLGQG